MRDFKSKNTPWYCRCVKFICKAPRGTKLGVLFSANSQTVDVLLLNRVRNSRIIAINIIIIEKIYYTNLMYIVYCILDSMYIGLKQTPAKLSACTLSATNSQKIIMWQAGVCHNKLHTAGWLLWNKMNRRFQDQKRQGRRILQSDPSLVHYRNSLASSDRPSRVTEGVLPESMKLNPQKTRSGKTVPALPSISIQFTE